MENDDIGISSTHTDGPREVGETLSNPNRLASLIERTVIGLTSHVHGRVVPQHVEQSGPLHRIHSYQHRIIIQLPTHYS